MPAPLLPATSHYVEAMIALRRLGFVVLLLGLTLARADSMPPDQLIRNSVQELVTLVRQDREIQAGNRQRILAVAQTKIVPHFDFVRMTRLALGRYWRQATPEQQQRLIKEFRELLINTYVAALSEKSYSEYKDFTVEFEPFRMPPDATDVSVDIAVKHPGRPSTEVEYSLLKTSDGWRVYDVKVAGVSLVINYRASFASQVRQGGIEGLIHTLTEKNQSFGSHL